MDTRMRTTKIVLTEGGWIWWLGKLRESQPECCIPIAQLLQLYIKGTSWEDVK